VRRWARVLLLGTNLVLGILLLGWLLQWVGRPALQLLSPRLSILKLAAFLVVVAVAIVCFTWRWRLLLAGLGDPPPLLRLVGFRSAGQTLAALIPSAQIGGDPLRAWLATRAQIAAHDAIATVATDRALEIGAAAPFSVVFAAVLIQQGIPELRSALFTMVVATLAFAMATFWTARRLGQGKGLVTSFARRTGLDTLPLVERRMDVLASSEAAATRLIAQRRRLAFAFLISIGTNLLVLLEFGFLLSAFGLPADAVAIVAAIFATAAARQLPVPAGIGVLEGGQLWVFGMLGYPPEVGLAVGLAVRFRELVWALPGLVYLAGGWLGSTKPAAKLARSGLDHREDVAKALLENVRLR